MRPLVRSLAVLAALSSVSWASDLKAPVGFSWPDWALPRVPLQQQGGVPAVGKTREAAASQAASELSSFDKLALLFNAAKEAPSIRSFSRAGGQHRECLSVSEQIELRPERLVRISRDADTGPILSKSADDKVFRMTPVAASSWSPVRAAGLYNLVTMSASSQEMIARVEVTGSFEGKAYTLTLRRGDMSRPNIYYQVVEANPDSTTTTWYGYCWDPGT